MEIAATIVYLIVKAIAYIAWCYVGVRWFQPDNPSPRLAAVAFGLGRLLLGVGVGLVIFLAALTMNNATRNAPLTYAVIYVPIRVIEWSVWYIFIRRRGSAVRAPLWIIGGVILSCLADLPIGIAEHGVVPVGRPFC